MARSDDRPVGGPTSVEPASVDPTLNARLREPRLPARPVVGALVLAGLVGLLVLDHAQSRPINPFAAPPPVALGSGQAPQGAHCTDL